MPQYFFTVRAGDGEPPERVAELTGDAAALAYGCDMARELLKTGIASTDPGSRVTVADETRRVVLFIPILAARLSALGVALEVARQKPVPPSDANGVSTADGLRPGRFLPEH
jgi:hypothetical protein